MNIWLDDIRIAPSGWIHLHNIDEVYVLVETMLQKEELQIEIMSFDFHLSHEKRGVDVMKFLAELCLKHKTKRFWPKEIRYHSSDPKGVLVMKKFAEGFESVFFKKTVQ